MATSHLTSISEKTVKYRPMATTLEHVHAVAGTMRGYPHPWWFAGGWAIDLFAGGVSREHHDVEIGVWREDQAALHEYLAGHALRKVVDGRWSDWRGEERIDLPVFQLRADGPAGEFDVFLNDGEGDRWVFRRNEAVTLPVSWLVLRTTEGLPVLAPEVQLLYKAKYHRPQDEADFALVAGRLGVGGRAWLAAALCLHHPGDPWITRLVAGIG